MRTDHRHSKQQSFGFAKIKSAHRLSHGGVLYQKRAGRGARPLSTKESLHLVFKINKEKLRGESLRKPQNFQLIHQITQRYAKRFFVKIEQISIQADHIHVLIRTTRLSYYHHFFRVTAGQIAQSLQREGRLKASKVIGGKAQAKPKKGTQLWKYRPFTRVIRGYKAYNTVKNYVQLNEKEAQGKIIYRKERLKGLSAGEWEILWA